MVDLYAKDDKQACVDLFVDVFTHEPWRYAWMRADSITRYFADMARTPGFLGLVMKEDGILLGFCFGLMTDYFNGVNYEIKEIAVARACQRQGMGSRLLAQAEQWLQKKGVNTITLATRRDIGAYAFYMKNSYDVSEAALYLYKNLQ